MLNTVSGTDLLLAFETKIDGEYVIPDAGSLKLTIRGADGLALAGFDAKALPDITINHLTTLVPAASNILPTGKDLETRYAEFSFTALGKPGVVKTNYRVIKFMPVEVGPEEVRQALGVSYQELPDESLDIFQSYIALLARPGFETALSSGTIASIYANRILLYTEALRIAPSLQARILKQEEKDNAFWLRFTLDFEQLKADLLAALHAAEDALDGVLDQTTTAVVPLLVVTAPTDRVTG